MLRPGGVDDLRARIYSDKYKVNALWRKHARPPPDSAGARRGGGRAGAVMLVAATATGPTAMWALISVGLFHWITFPTIFIRGLGP